MARYIDADKIDYTMASVYWGKDDDGKDLYRRSAVAFERDIDEMPTADVAEVKHGEWITDKTEHIVKIGRKNSTKHISYRCSECGRKVGCNKSFNYCPCCGAKMDGGKAE